MSDWSKEHFEKISRVTPGRTLPGSVSTNFWELLYQAFKQRLEDEQSVEVRRLDINDD